MALQSRGFQINQPAIPAQIDFSQLKPGSFINGLNSGIGTFNAFQNIVDAAQERPLREQERRARLAQIEAEADLAPTRAQMAQISLNRASLPDQIVTGTTAERVPRADNPVAYDIAEVVEGFTFDPVSQQRVPFKRQGKILTTAEEMADMKTKREIQQAQIDATKSKIADEKAYKDEVIALKKAQQAAKETDLAAERIENIAKAERAGLKYTEGERNGLKVGIFVHPTQGIINEIPLGVKPIRAPNPFGELLGGSAIGGAPAATTAPPSASIAPNPAPAVGDEDLINKAIVELPAGFTMEIAP